MARQGDDRTVQWSTVTHARIRAAQGDLAGARAILESVLLGAPEHQEARRLMRQLEVGIPWPASGEIEETVAPRRPADARSLAGRFRRSLGQPDAGSVRRRIARLERWLAAVGGPGVSARPDGS